tara:strand:- start:368 stop:1315 length:948 start_codon:yes stop_codon:yes gene_type:complete
MRNHFLRAGRVVNNFINTDLFIHYDFGNISCWNRQNGTNAADYTVYNLANSHNNALFRCLSAIVSGNAAYQHDSGSDAIIFDSSDGGGCFKSDPSEVSSDSDKYFLILPGYLSNTSTYFPNYNLTTEELNTGDNNIIGSDTANQGIGTGAFTFEIWVKYYLNTTTYAAATHIINGFDTSSATVNLGSYLWGGGWSALNLSAYPERQFRINNALNFYPSGITSSTTTAQWTNWNHLVISRANGNTNGTTVYLNNESKGTTTISVDLETAQYTTIAAGSLSTEIPQKIGVFRFYKGKALTSSEVTHNWNAQKSRFGH